MAALIGEDPPSLDDVYLVIGNERIRVNSITDIEDSNHKNMLNMFLEKLKENSTGVLLEIGSRARSGKTYRDWFPNTMSYIGLDVTDGPNVDIIGDAHHITRYIKTKVDFVFSISTFEHLLMPWKAVIEINKVMSPGGVIFTQSHQTWTIHETPWDFWRFTRDGWSGLFNRHTGFEIVQTSYAQRSAYIPSFWTQPGYQLRCSGIRLISRPLVLRGRSVSQLFLGMGRSGRSPTFRIRGDRQVARSRRELIRSYKRIAA